MSYDPKQSGAANYNSWMQLNDADMVEVTGQEGIDSIPWKERKYAQLSYQVNATPIQITGGLSATITSVGLNADGTVQLSGDALKVSDEAVVNAIGNIVIPAPTNYSSLIRVSGDYTYVMKSTIGAGLSGDAIWQIQRVEGVGTDTNILWADGNDNFDNSASGYLDLTYSL